jgi:chitodextrinase
LSWTAATDDAGVTGYQVRQAGTVIATVGGSTLSYTVTGLTPATAYTFTVTAGDANGAVSSPSNAVTVTTDPAGSTNLARGKATSESSHVQTYASGNAVDGDATSYWESANNAFPQWLQVDLGGAMPVGRVVLKLPPSSSWATRTHTLSVQGSTMAQPARLTARLTHLRPGDRQSASISFSAGTVRWRINVTANTGPAGQVSELEVYSA